MNTLEQRHCLCGCGCTFRVRPDNKLNYFTSRYHARLCRDRKDEVGVVARAFLKATSSHVGQIHPKGANSKAVRLYRKTVYDPQSDLDDFIEPKDADA